MIKEYLRYSGFWEISVEICLLTLQSATVALVFWTDRRSVVGRGSQWSNTARVTLVARIRLEVRYAWTICILYKSQSSVA